MNYLIIPDRSTDHKKANYKDANGNFFIITPTDAPKKTIGGVVTDDISQYTLLPAIVAKQAAALERAKTEVIKGLNQKLEQTLAAGVTVGSTGFSAVPTGLVLAGAEYDRNAFSQGTVLLQTAESLASDKVAFQNLNISQVFGRGIIDVQGNVHDMPVAQYKQMMVAYGQAIGAAQAQTLSTIGQVQAATTIEDVKKLKSKKNA